MLASRVLPPILRPPSPLSPVATFFNIPRRYVKSSMQVSDNASRSSKEDTKPSGHLHNSGRVYDTRSAATSGLVERTKQGRLPSPSTSSPRVTRKRAASYDEEPNGGDPIEGNGLGDSRAPLSASSAGSGELSGHVCLCQPEPKIPRPRNGKP